MQQNGRVSVDLDLKRFVENIGIKTSVSLGLKEETITVLTSRRKRSVDRHGSPDFFFSRSDAAEYYLRKGMLIGSYVYSIDDEKLKAYIQVKLSPELVHSIDGIAKQFSTDKHNVSRSAVAEYFLKLGFKSEGLN
jgi:hypothetical protein